MPTSKRAKWGSKQTIETRISYRLKQCHDVFKTRLRPNSEFISCRILNMCPQLPEDDHISVACNLDDMSVTIINYLSRYKRNTKAKSIECDIVPYLLLLYIMESTILSLFFEMNTGIKLEESKISAMRKVRRWANFFKHPKSFVYLSHHPKYTFENSQVFFDKNPELEINTEFVCKYYKDKKSDLELKQQLHGKYPVLVVIPDIVQLTEEFAKSVIYIFDVIEGCEMAKEYLMANCVMKGFHTR